jgi:beta-fructofuranosidase
MEDMKFQVEIGAIESIDIQYKSQQHAFLIADETIPLHPSDIPQIHVFVDGSVLELIFSERAGYTKRFYYSGNIAPDITLHTSGSGTRVDAWDLSPISTNRLTTITSNI